VSVRWRPSVAWQLTVFCPIVNGDPGKGVQFVTTGAWPFAIVGEANVTVAVTPSVN